MKTTFYMLLLCAIVSSCSKDEVNNLTDNGNNSVRIQATLRSEDPNTPSNVVGHLDGTVNTSTREVTYTINLMNMVASYSHIHDGNDADDKIVYTAIVESPQVVKGNFTLNQADVSRFMNGEFEADVHSFEQLPGSIRGKITKIQ